jgi:hypothetical protein
MRNIDELIDEALSEEESALLRDVGEDKNVMERALGMFGAGVGWTISVMMVVQTAMFIVGFWTAWNFFQAAEPVAQLRWGLPTIVLLLAALIVKVSVVPAIHHNRMMRELKFMELQIARLRG